MLRKLEKALQRSLRLLGLDLRRYVGDLHDLSSLLERYGVDCVFDVGANSGMSGAYFRNLGFTGKMVSFEPVSQLYQRLALRAAGDPLWLCENVALGEVDGEREIHVAGGSGGASSFLVSNGLIEANAPELRVIGRQKARLRTLRSVIAEHYPRGGERLFVKIDAQGYERRILEGGGDQLARAVGLRIELSVARSYENEPLICDMLPYLYGLGYRLCGIEEAWSSRSTTEVFQVDAVLFRTAAR